MYIPETTWNDTSQSLPLNPPDFSSSGGGASTIFTKAQTPWQTGPGVPADGKRDVPDIALNASVFHDPYLFCTAGSCVNGFRDASNGLSAVGGTSAGAPTFAGILAIINQATQAATGQGNVNPNLYSLAVSKPSAFNDIANGNNKVPCTTGTPNCPSGTASIGFTAGANYDQVTGLGSPDAFNLVSAWPGFSSTQVFAVGASPIAITAKAGQSGNAQVVAGASNGFTGNVDLSCDVGTAASAQVSCSISPSSISLGGGTTSGTATLTIHTAAASAAIIRSSFLVLAFSLAIPGIFLLTASTAHRRRKMLGFLSLGLIAMLVGCGGGGSSSGSKTPGTPAGTYAITVTGTAGATSHTANISFTVQ